MTGLRSIAVKFFAFAILSGLAGVLLLNTMVNDLGGDSEEFSAVFNEVSGLRPGDDIKVAGVRVGQVNEIEVVDGQAKVSFELRDDQPLYDNAKLVLRYQNLLGQRYLSLQQPDRLGEELEPGTELSTDQTDSGFDLTVLLNGFRPLFNTLQPAEVNQLAESLVMTLQGEGGTVEEFLQQTAQFTNFLADRDQVFGQVLDNLTPVLDNIAGQDEQLRGTITELRALMTGLAKDRKVIGDSIDGIAELIDVTSNLVVEAKVPTERALARLQSVAALYANNRGGLVSTLEWFPKLVAALGRITQNTNQGNIYACNIGFKVAGQTVWPVSLDGPYSEVCR
jgi:phospholipid/cholesterol/gamma-HCH transport system substrate-binding protein